jgi:hypothetical protein
MSESAERGFTLLGMVGVVLSSWQDDSASGSDLQQRTGL